MAEVNETNYLPDLMDRFRAIIRCGVTRQVEAAQFVVGFDPADKKDRARAERYITYWMAGTKTPGGEYALRIRDFCAVQTLIIAKGTEELREKYREAFAETETGKEQV